MPSSDSSCALRYEEEPTKLLDFFQSFEEIATVCELKEEEKVKSVIHYTNKDTRDFWKSLDAYDEGKWDVFKKAIIDLYPGASKGQKYTRKQLEKVASSWVKKTMNSEKRLLKYYGEFRPVARWLKKEEILSEKEINRIFWYGLPQHAHRKIRDRLKIVSLDRDWKHAPGIEDVIKAGRYVFTEEAFDAESDDNEPAIKKLKKSAKAKRKKKKVVTNTESSESESEGSSEDSEESESEEEERRRSKKRGKAKEKVKEVWTRKVRFDEEARKLDEVEELTKRLSGMHVGDVMYAGVYAKLWKQEPEIARCIPPPASWIPEVQVATLPVHAPVYNLQPASPSYPQAPTQQYQAPSMYNQGHPQRHGTHFTPHQRRSNDLLCHFCRMQNCRICDCPMAGDYIRTGRIQHDHNGRFVYINGDKIGHHPGGIRMAIDKGRWGTTTTANTSQANSPPTRDPPPHMPPMATSGLFQCVGMMFATILEMKEEEVPPTMQEGWVEENPSELEVEKDWEKEVIEEEKMREELAELAEEMEREEKYEEEESDIIWGAFEDLERLNEEAATFITTRPRGKKKNQQSVSKKHEKDSTGKQELREIKENTVHEEEEKKKNNAVTNTVKGKSERVEEKKGKEKEVGMKNNEPWLSPNNGPAYSYESRVADPEAANKFYKRILKTIIPNVTVGDIISLSRDVRKAVVEQFRTIHVLTVISPGITAASILQVPTATSLEIQGVSVEFCTPL